MYLLDAVTSSGISKAKQKLGRTFNSDKLGGIDFTKFSKLSMCSKVVNLITDNLCKAIFEKMVSKLLTPASLVFVSHFA